MHIGRDTPPLVVVANGKEKKIDMEKEERILREKKRRE